MVLAHGILHKLAIAITLAIHTSGDASNASHVLIHPSAAMAKAVRSEAFLRVDPITLPVLLRRNERLWEFRERRRVSVRHLRKKRSACFEPTWLRMTPDSAI